MSMIGELRPVSPSLIPALHDKVARKEAFAIVVKAPGTSLDKAWDGLSYLLAGKSTVHPLAGVALRGIDAGYGPPQLLQPEAVATCAAELAAIDEQALRDAYSPESMAACELYPEIWDRESERESNLVWLLEVFREVRGFYQAAAARGDGVIYYLT